jgi:hypothetical protein
LQRCEAAGEGAEMLSFVCFAEIRELFY